MKTVSLSVLSSFLLASTTFGATLSSELLHNSLIVYNGSVALVHESRHLHVDKSDTQIIYEGVANTIETDSVNVELPESIVLTSQQFRFDQLTLSKLLEAHLGKTVRATILKTPQEFETIDAVLLSYHDDTVLVKTADHNIISLKNDQIAFGTIPQELITKPSLVWNIHTDQTLNTTMRLDYLISNISWKSDYILNLGEDDANLSGWITIDNRSGKAFENTQLHLLAGSINRATPPKARYKAMMVNGSAAVEQVAHEGYHFYSIPFDVTLANNEKTQIKFIEADNLHVNRRYDVTLSNPSYLHGERKHSVSQYLHLDGFNFPLPKGVVRTYSTSLKHTILLGETLLPPTAKQTPVTLRLGDNFDLQVEESVLQRDDDKRYFQASIRYSVHNRSDRDKRVELLIPFENQKKNSIDTTVPFKVKKGNLVSVTVAVKANSTEDFKIHFRGKR